MTGCAWLFQEHLPSDYEVGQRDPVCTTTIGWQALDAVFGALNGVAAIDEITNSYRTDADNAAMIFAAAWTVVHTASMISGGRWANQCERARKELDDNDRAQEDRAEARRERTREREQPHPDDDAPAPAAAPSEERRIVRGEKPIYCTTTVADPERGSCFLEQTACAQAATAAGYTSCAARTAASCFNANRVLDGTRVTVCAPSVKDCETQRAAKAADPDFGNLSAQCGVYRVETPQSAPQPTNEPEPQQQ